MLDVYIAVGRVARERNYTFPVVVQQQEPLLQLNDFFHPLIANAIPNNLDVSGVNHVIFLTGANMAGKSTFMKSVSIVLLLAHMGFPVPAAHMKFAPLDGLYTTINLPDNLGIGASHFYAEVLRVKKIVRELAAGKRLFVVFDELFRGTNVKDAYEGTVAITRGFAGAARSMFIVSTHVLEAADTLREDCAGIQYVYMPTEMNGTQPVYSYRMNYGVSADRHGMLIVQNEGILEMLEKGLKKQQ
jgi:DNA mismatch repair ATPase MutS